jgi:hypothetical protein
MVQWEEERTKHRSVLCKDEITQASLWTIWMFTENCYLGGRPWL